MNDDDLHAGDVVQLRSGGVPMTMREPYMDRHGIRHAQCDWHDGTTPKGSVYPLSALVRYKPSEDHPEPPPQNPVGFAPPEPS